MSNKLSLGIMEQKLMRKENISEEEAEKIGEIFNRVTHVEGKYLDTLPVLKGYVDTLGGGKPLILHAQYPAEGAESEILNMVDPGFKAQLGDRFREILDEFDPEWFSLHLGFSCERMKSANQFDFVVAGSEVLPRELVRGRIVENTGFVQETYCKKGRVLLENLDYNPEEKSGAYEYVCDPSFIKSVLDETGAGMLLDVAHANVSAQNMGYPDAMEFLRQLPLEEVVEIHIAGAGRRYGLAHDTHLPIHREGQPESGYLENLLRSGRMTRLKAITLETFEEVLPQLELLEQVVQRSGYEIAPCSGMES